MKNVHNINRKLLISLCKIRQAFQFSKRTCCHC